MNVRCMSLEILSAILFEVLRKLTEESRNQIECAEQEFFNCSCSNVILRLILLGYN